MTSTCNHKKLARKLAQVYCQYATTLNKGFYELHLYIMLNMTMSAVLFTLHLQAQQRLRTHAYSITRTHTYIVCRIHR